MKNIKAILKGAVKFPINLAKNMSIYEWGTLAFIGLTVAGAVCTGVAFTNKDKIVDEFKSSREYVELYQQEIDYQDSIKESLDKLEKEYQSGEISASEYEIYGSALKSKLMEQENIGEVLLERSSYNSDYKKNEKLGIAGAVLCGTFGTALIGTSILTAGENFKAIGENVSEAISDTKYQLDRE